MDACSRNKNLQKEREKIATQKFENKTHSKVFTDYQGRKVMPKIRVFCDETGCKYHEKFGSVCSKEFIQLESKQFVNIKGTYIVCSDVEMKEVESDE